MNCPKCQGRTSVFNTSKSGTVVSRTRECCVCLKRFKTEEKMITEKKVIPVKTTVSVCDQTNPLLRLF